MLLLLSLRQFLLQAGSSEHHPLGISSRLGFFFGYHQRPVVYLLLLFHFLQIFTTFSFITFSWIFFRADSIDDALYIATHLFSNSINLFDLISSIDLMKLFIDMTDRQLILGMPIFDILVAIIAIVIMQWVLMLRAKGRLQSKFSSLPIILKWPIYYVIIVIIIYYMSTTQPQFIYFQF